MNIEKKIKSLTAKEIILAMVEGLENPTTKINMDTFGEIEKGICYGCAATNTICKIGKISSEKLLKVHPIRTGYNTLIDFGLIFNASSINFITSFEFAIDCLRKGYIYKYNIIAKEKNFAVITKIDKEMPYLNDNYTKEDLEYYIKLAELQ